MHPHSESDLEGVSAPGEDDLETTRKRYERERDRRLRADGSSQYELASTTTPIAGGDPWAGPSPARAPLTGSSEVIILGGGFGGLLMGARLREDGVDDLLIIDNAGGFGGTWYWNRYPGVQCDIDAYVYLPLLEELDRLPSWKYASGNEIREHAEAIGRNFGLYERALFQTEVTELRWLENDEAWLVRTNRHDELRARYVVVGTGNFGRPKFPRIEGIGSYEGRMFHTARWDYEYTGGSAKGDLKKLADQKVALIGTGATAIQVVPHLAESAGHLFVVQRTPSSVDVRGNRPTEPELVRGDGRGWQQRRRDNFFLTVHGRPQDIDLIDDGWTRSARLLSGLMPTADIDTQTDSADPAAAAELADLEKMNQLRRRVDEIVQDPRTAQSLKPWYRYMCKRPTFSDTYLQAFNRTNVTLVDTEGMGVECFTQKGFVARGQEYEVDCIIFATGFDAESGSSVERNRIPIYGRGGLNRSDHWKNGLRTLHGFYSSGFPNLFNLGTSQNGASANFVHILIEQVDYVGDVLRQARHHGGAIVEPTSEAEDNWVATIRAKTNPQTLEFLNSCTPGYFNGEGTGRERNEYYGEGPVAFYELIRQWRQTDDLSSVLKHGGRASSDSSGTTRASTKSLGGGNGNGRAR